MIPKIIHYAWIGTELPNDIKKRINMWKYKLPEWEFILWNENNYDFGKFKFTKLNYDQKRWAYATDELRYDVVNKYGGFYLDTDMVIKRNLDEFRKNKMTMGFMYDNSILTSFFGAERDQPLLNELLEFYEANYSKLNKTTNNPIVTYFLLQKFQLNFRLNNEYQEIGPGIKIYPREYFCCPNKNTHANYAEHLFDNSWGNANEGIYGFLKKQFKQSLPSVYWNVSNRRGIKGAQNDLQKLKTSNLKI